MTIPNLFRRNASKLLRNAVLNHRSPPPPRTALLHTATATATASASPDAATTTGLYGFSHLKSPKGFQRFVDDAIERSVEIIANISSQSSSPEVIRAMDELSDTVCAVVDSAELCRSTHPDREFVEEATKASIRINEYLHHLNTNHTLYEAVKKAEGERHMLSDEARRASQLLRLDFERSGIHLSPEKVDRVNKLNLESLQLCREFNDNIVMDPGSVDIFPASCIPKDLHHLAKPIYRSASSTRESSKASNTVKEKGFRIITDPSSLASILQSTPDEEVRKLVYVSGNSSPRANLGVLEKLLSTRRELAQLLGYKNYADFQVKLNMASSAPVVMSFLQEMTEMVRPSADEEFRQIGDFKRKKCGHRSGDLEPWDEAYYKALMKSSAYKLDASVIASYFSLPLCIEGLKVLVHSLFGATFCSVPLAPGESWHPDVLKMSLHHPDEGDLGYLYLDLHSRKGKYTGCAHFAIRGGRRISETDYQLPVVALVCNFSGYRDSLNVRLNHSDVETLFHEFGHAIHSLLSRTEYQHFSGTRVALDLAETPSNLFEYYAWDYRVLKTFAKHYSTGEVIPEKLVSSMKGARDMFAATEMQRQVFYAMVDQTLYGDQTTPPSDASSIFAELKTQYTSWKHVEGTNWCARFNHLLGYGGGYYSYLYARCFAASIWHKVCKDDPLSLSTGTALRTEFLQHGGAKEPAELLVGLAGDGILRYSNGGVVPDFTSLRDEMKLMT